MIKFIRTKLKIIAAITLILIIIFIYYQNNIRSAVKKTATSTVKKGTLEKKMTLSGQIDAEEKATLKFQTSGRLSWVGVKEGDFVKKYQGIASLDQRDVEKNLKKKLLAYMNERWDFEQSQDDKSVRGRYIYQVPGLTDAERRFLDKAQFDLDTSVLDVEIAALAKEYSFLWTPIEGIITSVTSPFTGVNITPAGAEFEIINPKSVYFSATADQTEVVSLLKDMNGELILDSFPESTLSGNIKDISFIPKSGETGTVYEIKFTFNDNNSNYKYRIGMTGDLTFVIQKKESVIYVPSKFVKSQNGKKYLNVKTDGKIEKTYVATGLETDSDVEITSGINESDTIYD